MPILSRHQLSGSDNGTPISVTATGAASAQHIHTVQATDGMELVTIWAHVEATGGVDFEPVIQVTNGAVDRFHWNAAKNQSIYAPPVLCFNQLPFSGTDVMFHAYATDGQIGTVLIWGHVDRIATG